MTDITTLGPYVAGEIPEPWQHTFDDVNGLPIDISAFNVRVTYRVGRSAQIVRTGSIVSGPLGEAAYAWVAADFATAGIMRGEMTVGNGSSARYARSFIVRIKSPAGGALPAV